MCCIDFVEHFLLSNPTVVARRSNNERSLTRSEREQIAYRDDGEGDKADVGAGRSIG